MLINIEMKGPRTPEVGVHYNYGLVCEKVKEIIEDFGISDRIIVSSFRPEIANMMKMEPKQDFKVLQLYNDWDEPE